MRIPTAIELDYLVSELEKLPQEQYAALRAEMIPIADADQAEAAGRETLELAKAVFGTKNIGNSVPDWMRLGLLDSLIKWATGQAKTCRHMPDCRRPEPVLSCAWKPGLVVCLPCAHLIHVTGDAARICDCCGTLTPEGGMFPLATVYGNFMYQAGACIDCKPGQYWTVDTSRTKNMEGE